MKKLVAIVLSLLAGLVASASAQFAIHNGDRVVFYGDSITEQRLYTNFTEAYVITRFPHMNDVKFWNAGIGGDRVTGGWAGQIDERIPRDILAYKPTVLTIMLGMNDAGYRAYDEALFKTYSDGYRHIVDTVKAQDPGVRITLIQPSPFDDVTRPPTVEGGYNNVLRRYSDFLAQLAHQEGAGVADLNTPVVADLQRANQIDPEDAQKIVPDRVHPGPAGHWLMAEALLKSWNAPAVVSDVTLDAGAGRASSATHAKVTEISKDNGLTWTETDDALPLPLDLDNKEVQLVLKASDLASALDREMLKISGLSGSSYKLTIDGEDAGTYSASDLAAGVNLATVKTPMLKQSRDVLDLTNQHNDIHRTRWIDLQFHLHDHEDAAVQQAERDLDRVETEIVQRQHAAAQPRPHKFELHPAR